MITATTMEESLISIIVPVYNVESYLKKCVDSIINQTYQKIEVILVDDGSSDGCAQICDEYQDIDNRVRVLHKKNGVCLQEHDNITLHVLRCWCAYIKPVFHRV